MSATSSDLQLDNENSYSSRTKGGTEKDKKNTTNWENGKRSSSNSKSETKSVSSKYDDKSEHFERLLRESQQHLCNRDTIIDMLQKQLKRIEELYKKTLNQQQDIRQKYANVVLELSRLRVICDQLKTENSTLSRANEETTRRYRYEREDLQDELDTWRQEYDQLVRAINNMEKNTIVMKDILYSDDNYHQQILNGSHVEQLLEQYKQIQGALVVQNNKLDKFLEKFHLIGDGGCTIVRSLEGVRCIGMVQSRSLSSIVPDRLRSSREPEQTPTSEVRRPESRRRSEIPPPIVRNDYYNMERQSQKVDGSMRSHQVSIWHEEGKCPSVKVDDIIQTDSHSSICCVNMPPMMLESSRQINSVRSCCEEVLIVPEKFMQTNYMTKTPYLIANECLQTCSCSTSETSCCSELISPPVATAEAIQTGPSCESISDVIPSPVFTIDLATSPGSICVSIENAPEDTSPCSRSCCDLKIDVDVMQNAIQRIETAMQTESIHESICSVPQEKPLLTSTHSSRDPEVVPIPIVSREIAAQTSSISGSMCSISRGKTPPIPYILEIMPPRPILKEKTAISGSKNSLPGKSPTNSHSFRVSKFVMYEEAATQTGSVCKSIYNISQEKPSSSSHSHYVSKMTQTMIEVIDQDELKEGYIPTKPVKLRSMVTRWFPPPATTETGTSPPLHIHFLPEMHATESSCRNNCIRSKNMASITAEEITQTESFVGSSCIHQDVQLRPLTVEEASQTESICRDSSTLSDKVPSIITVEEVTQTVSIVGHSYTAPEVISPPQTIQQASQTESTCRDSCTLTHIVPSVMTMEETTQTVSIATPPTIEEASQTESTYRNSCTLSDKVSSTTTVEEVTQTVSVVGDSYTARKVISPPQTIQEASQTESTCRDSCTLTDIVPSVMTMEETTQTVSIATPPTIEETSQTESTYRNSCTLSDKVSSTTTVEEVTQTVSVVGDSYTAPKVISPPQTIQEASQTESMCRDSCTLTYIVPSVMTIEETTQTVSIATPPTIEEASQTESTCRDSCTLSDKLFSTKTVEEVIQMVLIVGNSCTAPEAIPPTLTIEEASQTVSIGGDGCISPEAISPVTAEKATQPDSIGEITTGTDTINASLISGLLLTAEEATQTATMGQICVTTEENILAPCITTSFFPETILLANAEKSTQTVSIGQITIGTSTSASSSGESLLTIEKFTQTTPIGQSAFLPEIRPATVEESTQTMSIDQISAATYLSSESILTTEESTQTASIRQIITEICASLPSLHLGSLPEVISSESVEETTNTELDGCSICAIPEVIPPPSSIGELAQSARPTPERQEQSVWVLPEAEDEATQIEIFSVPASIQTDGRASTYIDSHKFGVSIETQTTADQSTQTLNLECIDCCTETELQLDFDLYINRKLITCHKRSKSNQISRRSSAASCDEQELRTCCFCDEISLTVKPEATDKAICTDFLDSGDGSLLAENERLQQLILLKDLTIKRLQEESSLDSNKLKEVLVEKQKMQDENNALKQDLANIEDELEGLKKKLADVGQEISVTGNGKDYYISETNVLLNEYEASLQELNQKYASAITENQSLTEEVAVLMEQVSFLNETIKQHKEQASLCKLQLENMTEKAKELEDTIKDLEEQKEFTSNPSDNIDELNPALHELTEQYELLKEENESLLECNKEILLLKKKNSNLLHEIDAKDIVIDELQGHMAELQKELDSVKEEMESNNENAKEEMDKLIQVCSELEQKLETAKELLEKEVSLMDEEVSASLGPYNEHTDDYLQKELDKKAKQLQKAKEEMESVKDNFEEEILKLNAKNTLLQLQLEKEQLDHQREIETIEEKLAQCDKEYVSTVVSCSDIGSSDSSTTSSELTSLLEECVEKNKRLHEELRTCKEQIKSLRESGKECGLLKAENMKLKVQISALQKQLAEMKDVEEKLKQLKHEKEELIVKVKYLEKQLAISRCRCERAKKPPPCLDPIKEETSQRPIAAVAPKPKVPCCPCSQKKDHALLTLAAPCANNVNTNPSPDTDNTVTRKDSQICGALGTLNLRLASINRMEGQIDQMIMSVRRQNQRMNECNFSRFQSDKDIKGCLSNLRHKREQLMGSLNKFKQELTVFECKTKGRVCNCPKQRNPP